MSDLIRRGMLPASNVVSEVDCVRLGVHNVVQSAVMEPNPITRGTIVALLDMDVGVYPVKDVINLGNNVSPDLEQSELLMGLAEIAKENGDFCSALGYEVLAHVNPAMFPMSLVDQAVQQTEYKESA